MHTCVVGKRHTLSGSKFACRFQEPLNKSCTFRVAHNAIYLGYYIIISLVGLFSIISVQYQDYTSDELVTS